MNTKKRLYLFIILLTLPLFCVASHENWEKQLDELDNSLGQRKYYEEQKLKRIKQLKKQLVSLPPSKQFDINRKLFKEYSSYQYDSAYNCAHHLIDEAIKLKNRDYEVEARCDLVFCLLSAGLYTEAFNELREIRMEGTTTTARKLYFTMASRLYYDVSDYTRTEPYQSRYVTLGAL
mgnify:FL=1